MTEQPLPPGNVDAPAGASADRIKRRQYLLLAGVGAVIVIATVFSVSLTVSKRATERQAKPLRPSAVRTFSAKGDRP
jgi:hypothetical protein